MSLDTTELLLALGSILGGALGWTFYMQAIRKQPETEKWYDSANGSESGVTDRDASLYLVPYGSLFFGVVGMMMLLGGMSIPEPLDTIISVPLIAGFVIAIIGMTGILGIPLPWPFVPRWVVDIRKKKRARARQRREAKRAKKNR
ncbi:hypothetical protein [Brevibacterium ravenspurgense]|uniref:hypothetical protein n=1 Tax=Brevibacterium ravenspurgense TaxID=479117 RepID=UPI00031F8729|nr:hypothetical protein [Brevibacterium ravenspurgense]